MTEILRTALAVTLVIISIFLVLRGMGFLSQAAEGIIPVDAVLSLVTLKMVAYLDVMIPLMFYVATLMVLGRWYKDNEMVVLASAGMGLVSFLRPIAILIFIVGGLVAAFSFYLTPKALEKGYALEKEYRQSNELAGVIPGQFMESKSGQGVYFVEEFDRKTDLYQNVFVYKSSFEREGVVVAKTAYRTEDPKTQDQFLVLQDGTRYEGTPGMPDYRVIDFERYALRIEPKNQTKLYLPIRALSNDELKNSDNPKYRGEWYWRIAKVFTLPVLAIFALALSFVDSRRGKSTGMILAFLIYLTYTNLLGYAVALVQKGKVESGTPIWFVHIMFAIFAVYCLYRRNKNMPIFPELAKPSLRAIPKLKRS